MASESVFDHWREAESAAHKAEHDVFEMAMQFLEGKGRAPTEAQWVHSRELRAEADKRFQLAVAAMGTSEGRRTALHRAHS